MRAAGSLGSPFFPPVNVARIGQHALCAPDPNHVAATQELMRRKDGGQRISHHCGTP
jgi:hypothetical protein